MKRSSKMASRLTEVFLNGSWIANTNYQNQLVDINLQQATHQIGSLNTIAALTYHINYYLAGILNVFNGGKLEIRDTFSFDISPLEAEVDWDSLRDEFLMNATYFIQAIERMPDSKFDEHFVDEKYGTYERNIEGVIEHSYYHLGQISLIKKLVLNR